MASSGDLDVLVEHRLRMWEEIHPDRIQTVRESADVVREWVRGLLEQGKYVGFIAELPDGTLAGSGALWLRPEQPRPGRKGAELPYLLSMYTNPGFRNSGVASAIVREAILWSKQNGYYRIYLHASRMGRGVYEKLGFLNSNEMRLDLD